VDDSSIASETRRETNGAGMQGSPPEAASLLYSFDKTIFHFPPPQ
jgi:hypothetical protein